MCIPLSPPRQAFVKMVGRHVSFLEDHVLRAERRHGAFSQALRRWGWLGSRGLPSFRNVSTSPPPSSQPLEWAGLRKREVRGHVSLLQTGNGVWLAQEAGCLGPSHRSRFSL